MNVKFIFFLSFIISFVSCKTKKSVDTIFYNAHIYSVDSLNSEQEAFAIENGKIVFVGTTKSVLEKYDSKTKIDVKGKFIYPGFNDAHCHFVGYAGDMFKCQLFGTNSFEAILDSLKNYDKSNELGFIYGRGWDQNYWPQKQFPNNEILSKLFPSKPVFLKRIDGHAVLVNEFLLLQAKEVLQLFKGTSFIEIKNGKPTGILFDNAMEAVEKLLPKISKQTLIKNILKAQNEAFSIGLTSITEAGLNYDEILLIDSLQKAGLLKMNINGMVSAKKQNIDYFSKHPFKNSSKLRVASLKVYADGALGSRGACLKNPYSDDVLKHGRLNISIAEFDSVAQWAIKNNYQMCTHSIGDSTNATVLKVYAKYLQGKNNKRWRIEHAQVLDSIDIEIFFTNDIIASVQPTHATSDMYWAEERLGKRRLKTSYAYGTLDKQKVKLALGTDFPVEYFNPLYTFYAATSRKDKNGFPSDGFQIKDSLSRLATLRGMTIDAAYASFAERETGSIETGKMANFIITEFDLMHDNLTKIRNNKIYNTYIFGNKVY